MRRYLLQSAILSAVMMWLISCIPEPYQPPGYDGDGLIAQDGGDEADAGGSGRRCNHTHQCNAGEVCAENICIVDTRDGGETDGGTNSGKCNHSHQCDTSEICIDNACVPQPDAGPADAGSQVRQCNHTHQCYADEICEANECVPDPDLYPADAGLSDAGVELADAGEEPIDAGPQARQCNHTHQCEADEICLANQCVPDPAPADAGVADAGLQACVRHDDCPIELKCRGMACR